MDRSELEAIDGAQTTRRSFLRNASGALIGLSSLGACTSALTPQSPASTPRNRPIDALDAIDPLNGGTDPYPIPWLDMNGSHNQSPGPGMEPSNIFHFRGRVARANEFIGMGTDNQGRRLAFGAKSTDFSFMDGEYFAGRQVRRGGFGHI